MILNTIKLLNFMDIKKPQLGKVEAFARMGQLFRGVLQHPRVHCLPQDKRRSRVPEVRAAHDKASSTSLRP